MANNKTKIDFDPYLELEIKLGASEKEIKKAYRHLARVHHPDKAEDEEKGREKFLRLKEAYDFLMDKDQKDLYDRHTHAKVAQQKAREAKLAASSASRKRLIEELEKNEAAVDTKKSCKTSHGMSKKDLSYYRQQNQEALERHNAKRAEDAKRQEKPHVPSRKTADIDLDAAEADILGDLL